MASTSFIRSASLVTTALLLAAIALPTAAAPAPEASAAELLRRAITYHDPRGEWPDARFELSLTETRPDGADRQTRLAFDNRHGAFRWRTTRDGREVDVTVRGDEVRATLDGSTGFTAAEAERFRLSPDRARWIRDYYLYLYGLPMKLLDPGTRLGDDVARQRFEGRDSLRISVTYDGEVGDDTWFFYLDPESGALVGYRFHHDPSANDGEYITIEGVETVGGMRLPRARAWYVNADDRHLGTDTIVGSRVLAEGELR